MSPFPLPLDAMFGHAGAYFIYMLIGFAFGYVLEISGFAISTKLAAQFYFKDMTVLKVMFTGIIVAMVLIFLATGLGWLDYNLIWVNPTYLWPGIVGGLIMGVGFIVGGFCPGTSLVSAATFKIDGIFFAVGGLFGIFLFGETVQSFETFWNSSYFGRLTLMDWLGLPTGVVVIGVVLMALFMFWGGEQLERIFGGQPQPQSQRSWGRIAGVATLLAGALLVVVVGQPTTQDKWVRLASEKEALLSARAVQIHPGELLASLADDQLNVILLDVRDEADYNLFHLRRARYLPLNKVTATVPDLRLEAGANTVYVVMSNDERAATEAWKLLVAESVPNVYILEGGINNWLTVFGHDDPAVQPTPTPPGNESLQFIFASAVGDRHSAADPDAHHYELEYTPKIKLELKRGASGGGCG
ncbi:MAG: YeeE/YedE family protein [Caldilineaceae bacterium]|jgi:rhodanese-related sulfurtransferase|nr:YeeE/YedE family protein [Caldilineaceae bacterium]